MEPTASKEDTITGGVEGDCCLCGEHTHHGTDGYPPPAGKGIVCPGCLPIAVISLKEVAR